MATGLIVGESLLGVVYAGVVAGAEKAGSADSGNVLAVIETYGWAPAVSVVLFIAVILGLYAWTRGRASVPLGTDDQRAPVQADYR